MIADAAPAAAPPSTTVLASAAVPAVPMAEHAAEAVVAARLGAQLAAALEAQLQPILARLAAAATSTDVHRSGVAAATQTEDPSVRAEPRLDRAVADAAMPPTSNVRRAQLQAACGLLRLSTHFSCVCHGSRDFVHAARCGARASERASVPPKLARSLRRFLSCKPLPSAWPTMLHAAVHAAGVSGAC